MTLTPKGQARREALLEATLRVLERDGSSGVTHRAIATEAGVPVSAATYYFANLDDLYVSALRRATAEQVALFAPLANGDVRAYAESLHAWAFETRASAIAQYELMFAAMRRDSLRDDAALWYSTLGDSVSRHTPDARTARVVALAIDGLLLKMLWLREPSTVDAVEEALREIFAALRQAQ